MTVTENGISVSGNTIKIKSAMTFVIALIF